MILTEEMNKAIDLIENSSQPIYITGKAGTGKTTLLRHIIKTINKKFVVTASTGVAAINAGGVTLHSLMSIPFGVIDPNAPVKGGFKRSRVELIKRIDALIIDEVSMVTPDIIDYIDKKLRAHRCNSAPFGGVQIIMFGDLFQLPPVVPKTEKEMLSAFYDGVYFFYANVFKENGFNIVELTNVFRQADQKFVNLLNNIREYKVTQDDIEELGELRNKAISDDMGNDFIHICSLRKDVQRINQEMLGESTHTYNAVMDGNFNNNSAPCDEVLQLRTGAKVMILVNDQHQRYCNGSLATVIALSEDKVTVELENGEQVEMVPSTWESIEYKLENDKIVKEVTGSCTQIPLVLAWAITIHKSQGLTFDKVALHAKAIFAPGQLYVALSRCRSLEGLACDSFIHPKHIIVDRTLLSFEQAYKQTNNYFNNHTLEIMS